MGVLTCRACRMSIESEGIEDNPNWTCHACADAAEPTPIAIPPILTPAPMRAPDPTPSWSCPSCGSPLRLRKADLSAKFPCPSCRQTLSYDAKGNLEVYDEFKEYLKKRATQARMPKAATPKAQVATAAQPQEEAEPEEERTPAGLIFSFVLFPLAAAYGLSFWPDAYRGIEAFLKPVLKVLGLA